MALDTSKNSMKITRLAPSAAVCAILCLMFALIAAGAVRGKSATYDEPRHVAMAWTNLWLGDYRLSPDVPPLWEYWIGLPLSRDAMNFDATPTDQTIDRRAISALYQTPPARGIELVERSRWMSLMLAMLLAILVATWAGQLGGGVAAIAAMFAFTFDPNWLGHAALAKNDVAFALTYFAAAYVAWHIGRRGNWWSCAAVLILPGICLGTKLSGLVVGPVLAITLLIRALMPEPWTMGQNTLRVRKAKLAMAGVILIAATLTTYTLLWAQYRFRFDPAPGGTHIDMNSMVNDLRDAEMRSRYQTDHPTPAQLVAWKPGFQTSSVLWAERHHLVPQAWAAGYVYTNTSASERTAYLMGDVYPGGRWSYFPMAWLFKEPLAMIAATLVALIVGCRSLRWGWTACAMIIPPAVYFSLAVGGNLNIGLRHIFPVFPFIDVAIGVAAARLWSSRRVPAKALIIILATGLTAETLAAYPNFICFFNLAAGGERAGPLLLGDSNLDWGQDLPLLAQWQKQWQQLHPSVPLYLDYFGTCDPAAYGIRYINVPGGYAYGPPPQLPTAPGIAAISVSKLQRLFVADPAHDFATPFERAKPIGELGGTIYLFAFPPN
jgi:hypothetical protein